MTKMFDPNDPEQSQALVNQQWRPDRFGFEVRNAAIEQRKRLLADLMRRQGQPINMPEGKMVSGHYVSPSWAENLNAAVQPALAAWQANREGKSLAADESEYARADQEAAAAHVASRPQARPGYGANEMDNEAVPATQPSTQDMLAWAQKGKAIPSRRDVVSKLMADLEVNAPARAEAAQVRAQDREDRQSESRAVLNTNQQTKREQADRDEAFRRDKMVSDKELAAQRQADAQAMRALIAQGQQTANELRREQVRAAAEGKTANETAAHAKERQGIANQARDAQERMELLTDAQKAGETATGSGLGSAADKAASIFGYSTKGAKGAAQLKALQAQLLTLTPKLGGATSDADVRNYREAVGQIGDDTLPMATRQAAMDTVQAINQRDYDNALRRGEEFHGRPQGKRGSDTTQKVRKWNAAKSDWE